MRSQLNEITKSGGAPYRDATNIVTLLQSSPEKTQILEEIGLNDTFADDPNQTFNALTIPLSRLRRFVESPLQAWAGTILRMEESIR